MASAATTITRWGIIRAALGRPLVKAGWAIIGFAGLYDGVVHQLLPEWLERKAPRLFDFIEATTGFLPLWVWVVALAVYMAVATLEYAYRNLPRPRTALEYLSARDSELGSAIQAMARRSAWGRWYAAQSLAKAGIPIGESNLLMAAGTLVMDEIMNGNLEVRGRLPGKLEYQSIPRTDWRSSVVHFVPDQRSLWRMVVLPRGGATIDQKGKVKGRDRTATQRTAQIAKYDSLLVDSKQFEALWPATSRIHDDQRRKFLRQVRKERRDQDAIKALS